MDNSGSEQNHTSVRSHVLIIAAQVFIVAVLTLGGAAAPGRPGGRSATGSSTTRITIPFRRWGRGSL